MKMGALLVINRKERALPQDAGVLVAHLLARALVAEGIAGPEEVDPELCIVIDVFHGGVFRAPKRASRTLRDVSSACREIVARWQAIVHALSA